MTSMSHIFGAVVSSCRRRNLALLLLNANLCSPVTCYLCLPVICFFAGCVQRVYTSAESEPKQDIRGPVKTKTISSKMPRVSESGGEPQGRVTNLCALVRMNDPFHIKQQNVTPRRKIVDRCVSSSGRQRLRLWVCSSGYKAIQRVSIWQPRDNLGTNQLSFSRESHFVALI